MYCTKAVIVEPGKVDNELEKSSSIADPEKVTPELVKIVADHGKVTADTEKNVGHEK